MDGGSQEANIAYYCLHKLHKWPHEFLELDVQEQAYVIAAVELKLENDKKAAKEAKRKSKRKR
ncbi:hypothetical protein CRH03_24940 [Clostridium sp. HMb25]|nr:hypothetical protein CRH03_24940 [Clostridium sp. HMb25]